jgi:LuxR family maltose regulon positive regulatory protein
MAHRIPQVTSDQLVIGDGTAPIWVDSPAWFRWLQEGTSFAYHGLEGTFTARRSVVGTASYWRAYRKVTGVLGCVYLGRPQDVTRDRLTAAAQRLGKASARAAETAPDRAVVAAYRDPLLRAKTQPPPLRTRRVMRERLLQPLRDERRRLVLIVAPSGAGKTSLIADWGAVDQRALAWLTLDGNDNDPHRFLAALIAAMSDAHPGVAARVHSLFNRVQPIPAPTILRTLLDDATTALCADAVGRPTVLVLDDYHVISNPHIHELVTLIGERRLPTMRLIVLSRTTPPLPIARLQAHDEILALSGADLALTPLEAAAFLHTTMDVTLDDAVVRDLVARTEGSAAALQLAAFTAQHGVNSDLEGAGTDIAALVGEALAALPLELRRLLLSCAILDRLCPELCAAILGQRSITRIVRGLRALERAGLVAQLLDTDGCWYRLHRLVADELLRQLRALAPERERVLHRRAAVWFEREHRIAEAVPHALAAAAWAQAARLIEPLAEPLWRQGALATIEHWLRLLPQDVVAHHPQLGVIQAWALANQGRLGQAEVVLAAIERTVAPHDVVLPEHAPAFRQALALRAKIVRMRGAGGDAQRLGQHVLAQFADDDGSWRATALVDLAVATLLDDRPTAALELFQTAAALAQAHQHYDTALMALFHQASTLLAMGQLTAVQQLDARAVALAATWGVDHLPVVALADLHAALIHYERDQLVQADAAMSRGLARFQHSGHALMEGQLYVAQAIIAGGRGDCAMARGAIDRAVERYTQMGSLAADQTSWRSHFLTAWRAYILANDASDLLQPWLHGLHSDALPPLASWIYRAGWLATARAQLTLGEPEQAHTLIAELVARAERAGARDVQLKLLVLLARAEQQRGQESAAAATLLQAIRLGMREGYVRSILDEGTTLTPLLSAINAQPGVPSAARALVRRLQHGQATPWNVLDDLTARERDVARLLRAGHSNAAIAVQLVLSSGTVKWHVSNILSKLGVRRRTELTARLAHVDFPSSEA